MCSFGWILRSILKANTFVVAVKQVAVILISQSCCESTNAQILDKLDDLLFDNLVYFLGDCTIGFDFGLQFGYQRLSVFFTQGTIKWKIL